MGYPSSVSAFSVKVDDVDDVEAAHVNDLQTEVEAIEDALLNGFEHDLKPGTTASYDLGTSGLKWRDLHLSRNAILVDSGKLVLGTGSDAELYYDGTDLVLNSAAVGSGVLSLLKGQLKFPATQNASTDANTLDDYEEGTWTPTIGGSGGQSGQAYTTQVGRYIKIGKWVYAWGYIVLSTLGTVTATAQIQGLPFTSENVTNGYMAGAIGFFLNFTANFVWLMSYVNPNAATADIYGVKAAATGAAAVVQGDLANNSQIMFSFCYRAAN